MTVEEDDWDTEELNAKCNALPLVMEAKQNAMIAYKKSIELRKNLITKLLDQQKETQVLLFRGNYRTQNQLSLFYWFVREDGQTSGMSQSAQRSILDMWQKASQGTISRKELGKNLATIYQRRAKVGIEETIPSSLIEIKLERSCSPTESVQFQSSLFQAKNLN